MINKIFFLVLFSFSLSFISCNKNGKNSVTVNQNIPPDPNKYRAPTPITMHTPVPADGKYPEMTFETKDHDFGAIKQDEEVSYTFKFQNTGQADLKISQAVGSCGCTVPEFSKEPIKPGEKSKIKVSFNSTGKSGLQEKSVTLYVNTKEAAQYLHIKALLPEKNKIKKTK